MLKGTPLCIRCAARFYSTKKDHRTLELAYKLHNPTQKKEGERRATEHEPIIFMHGLFGSKQNNRSISKVLAKDLNRAVFAIDLRNHGESPQDPEHNYTVMAEDVESFIREQKLRKPSLIGHSMGAKVAMTLALRNPSLISALIPVDNAPIDAALGSSFGKYVKGMRAIEEAHVKKQSEADEILEPYESSLPIRQFLLTNLIRDQETQTLKFRIPIKILATALDHMADFPFRDPDEARYEGPTLIIRGTKSKYVADEALPVIGRFFPKFEVRDIDCGHWVISEKPEEFRKAVVEFFQKIS